MPYFGLLDGVEIAVFKSFYKTGTLNGKLALVIKDAHLGLLVKGSCNPISNDATLLVMFGS